MKVFPVIVLCYVIAISAGAQPSGTPEDSQILNYSTNFTRASLAYRTAAIEQMLEEANEFSSRLQLQTPRPIQLQSLKSIFVTPPWFGKIVSTDTNRSLLERIKAAQFTASGVLYLTNFSFAVYLGKLWRVEYTPRDMERFDLYPQWAKMKSLVDTNGAYQLATQWLSAVSVDVPTLERVFKVHISQWYFHDVAHNGDSWDYNVISNTPETMLPIFDVNWGEGDLPAVKVTVFGPTKELTLLEMQNASFSRRPPLIITNAPELNRIPDPPNAHINRAPTTIGTNSPGSINPNASQPAPFHQEIKSR